MSQLSKQELEDLKDEIQTATYNSINHIINLLGSHYQENFDDKDLSINNEFLLALATITGDVLSQLPESYQENITRLVHEHIDYTLAMAVTSEDPSDTMEDQVPDLASMTPRGNC